jgi:hypothetical protein
LSSSSAAGVCWRAPRSLDVATTRRRPASLLVPYDLAAERPRRVTPEERIFLEKYVDPA